MVHIIYNIKPIPQDLLCQKTEQQINYRNGCFMTSIVTWISQFLNLDLQFLGSSFSCLTFQIVDDSLKFVILPHSASRSKTLPSKFWKYSIWSNLESYKPNLTYPKDRRWQCLELTHRICALCKPSVRSRSLWRNHFVEHIWVMVLKCQWDHVYILIMIQLW